MKSPEDIELESLERLEAEQNLEFKQAVRLAKLRDAKQQRPRPVEANRPTEP